MGRDDMEVPDSVGVGAAQAAASEHDLACLSIQAPTPVDTTDAHAQALAPGGEDRYDAEEAVRSITVVLVDDHEIVDSGVRLWCVEADPPITVVESGKTEIVAWTGAGAAADVVVLDLLLRGVRPDLAVLRRLVEADRKVVVFTQYLDQATACIRIGALAYVTKAEGREHLVRAIQLAAQGRTHTPPALGGALLADDTPDRPVLTAAQVDALRTWFTAGSKELAAERLGKTPRAVDKLIEQARLRYALAGRPAPTQAMLLARALQDELITLEEMEELGPAQPPG